MENTLPTAEEFTKILLTEIANCRGVRVQSAVVEEKFIEFAKLHCEAQAQKIWDESQEWDNGFNNPIRVIHNDKESILNAYNLNNIK